LAGRSAGTLGEVAETIRAAGGTASVAQVDVLDRTAIERHVADVVDADGSIDVCFNATSNDDVQGRTLLDMSFEEFMQPVTKSLTAHFNIATAVARHMAAGEGGVILVMAGGREAIPRLGGAHVAWTALAGLSRQLAADLGLHGIRVAWLLSPGSPGSADRDRPDARSAAESRHEETAPGTEGLLPDHQPSYAEVADIAAFLASDSARTMTAVEINLTGGAVID
jgi:3-oxoacyl-[acyl-carrier protein] reductase